MCRGSTSGSTPPFHTKAISYSTLLYLQPPQHTLHPASHLACCQARQTWSSWSSLSMTLKWRSFIINLMTAPGMLAPTAARADRPSGPQPPRWAASLPPVQLSQAAVQTWPGKNPTQGATDGQPSCCPILPLLASTMAHVHGSLLLGRRAFLRGEVWVRTPDCSQGTQVFGCTSSSGPASIVCI